MDAGSAGRMQRGCAAVMCAASDELARFARRRGSASLCRGVAWRRTGPEAPSGQSAHVMPRVCLGRSTERSKERIFHRAQRGLGRMILA
jgi:hypothetical protein